MANKRKYKSGSQKRKERAQREQQQKKDLSINWMSQAGYLGTGSQYAESGASIELPIFGLPPSNLLPIINAAILQLEQGQFYSAAYLWDGITRDERISAALETRIDGTVGAQLDLLPADESTAATEIKEILEKDIIRMAPIAELYQLERMALGLSAGIAQVVSTQEIKNPDTGKYELQLVGGHEGDETTIYTWNNRYVRYDWLLRKYRVVTQNRGEITIEPGDNEWIVYEPYGQRGWLNGALIRQLVIPWFLRYWTRQWWGRRQEVHGQPIRLGIIPVDRDPADEKLFLSQLKNIAHETVIRIPQGSPDNRFDVKLLEANSADWQGFMEMLKHCDDSISTCILGQRQSTSGQGGLGTQEKAGESTIIRLLKKDAAGLSQALREQYIKPYCQNEYGNPDLAPFLNWMVEPPEDLEKKSNQFQKLSLALQQLSTAPNFAKHIDVRALLESFDVPLIPEDEVAPDVPYSVSAKPIDLNPSEADDATMSGEESGNIREKVSEDS